MSARAKAITPLAVVIGILSFLWTEFSLNFTFHWVTVQDELLGEGQLGLPENFQLILPTAFISWGLFFAAGSRPGFRFIPANCSESQEGSSYSPS